MAYEQQILERMKELFKSPKSTMLATVKSVAASEFTCVLYDEDTDLEYNDIRLRPTLDEKESVTLFPKVGTWCLAVRIEEDDDWVAIAFGEIDKVRIKVGTAIIEQDATGLLVKKGNDTLHDVLTGFIDEVMKIVVLQGTSPNLVALAQLKVKAQNLLKNGS